jgi:hypothetical protein
MVDWVLIYLIVIQTNQSTPFTPFLFSFNLHAVHPMIHDQGWHPRLTGQSRATRRRPCPNGVPHGREIRRFLCKFAWKLAGSLSRKHDWLSFGGLLVNLSMLHHERVISCCVLWSIAARASNALSSVWFGPHPTSTHFFATPLGKNLLRLYFVADSSCPSPTPRWSIF